MENFNEVLKQYTEEVWKTVERYLPDWRARRALLR